MSGRSGSLYNLSKAKELSKRLREAEVVTDRPDHEPRPVYTKFSFNRAAPPPPAAARQQPPAEAAEQPLPEVPEGGFEDLSVMLRWCREATGAEVCFVVDEQGFVLEHSGHWTYEEMEDFGSQLTVILTRADGTETAGKSRSITLSYEDLFLMGMQVAINRETEWLTIVTITREAVAHSRSVQIMEVIRKHEQLA